MTTAPLSVTTLRLSAALMVALVALFLVNNYLVHWRGWPPFWAAAWRGNSFIGALQWLLYATALTATAVVVSLTPARSLRDDAAAYCQLAAYVIRASFWAVLLIGLTDVLISFLRIEDFLQALVGKRLTTQLGRPVFRGVYVHYPLLLAALVIAWRSRALGFIWLSLLVVLAEFLVVVSRFVFSYEQVFMGDLVRFWYAALFLFASAYTLAQEGHVRVDVLYAGFSRRGKAWTNLGGALLLGLPLCWTILWQGMAGRGTSINSPLLGFEISQSGYGMYVKYLMAGFLLIFAVSMALQFVGAFLDSAAQLRDKSPPPSAAPSS